MSARPGPWHQALVYALLGERRPDLGVQDAPDLDRLIDALIRAFGGREALTSAVQTAQRDRSPWPVPLPGDLAAGLGSAQFWAALTHLRDRLAPRPTANPPQPRALTPEERRLLADVPPHHVG
jgi:hypothetical protein